MNRIKLLARGAVALAVLAFVSVGALPAASAGPGVVGGGKGIPAPQGSGDPTLALVVLGALIVLAAAFAGVKMYVHRRRPALAF